MQMDIDGIIRFNQKIHISTQINAYIFFSKRRFAFVFFDYWWIMAFAAMFDYNIVDYIYRKQATHENDLPLVRYRA
jgi:hypothetical protein